jgi:signal transduction histidine kinase
MSHELRTPLNAIAGHLQLLEMEVHGPVSDAQHAALERIDRAQRHLLRLVNDVLNFSRLKAGRLEYRVAPVRLSDVVAEVEPMIYPQLALKGVSYVVKVPADDVVQADFEKLVQVLLNLVSNAVKFTPQGGVVSVECAKRAVETRDTPLVHLRVRDTGPGIAVEKLDQIFEPFVQIDANQATRSAGTGLGLAISRDLMRGMGGELRARSTVGEGSTFTISLPRATP